MHPPTYREKVINPASNSVIFQQCEFVGDGSTPWTFNSIPVVFENCITLDQPVVFNQLLDNLATTSGGSFGNIAIQSANAPPANTPYTLQFGHSVQSGAAPLTTTRKRCPRHPTSFTLEAQRLRSSLQ
jgi:hypothetical protein